MPYRKNLLGCLAHEFIKVGSNMDGNLYVFLLLDVGKKVGTTAEAKMVTVITSDYLLYMFREFKKRNKTKCTAMLAAL